MTRTAILITKCPRCSRLHRVHLSVATELEVPVFGGGERAADRWEVSYTCPDTRQRAVTSVTVLGRPGEKVLGVSATQVDCAAEEAQPSQEVSIDVDQELPPPLSATRTVVDLAFEEWVKASTSTPRDFCKTMLTACTAAVPVFFAVMKFLGVETTSARWLAWSGIAPPTLFLMAAITYVIAMQPKYTVTTHSEFITWQRMRLSHTNSLIRAATSLYGAATALAILIFALILAIR